ncbi:MAG: protein phosphatase, partial [Longimicrobiales bacterium]
SRDELAEMARQFPEPATLCDALVALANQRGGPDNITVIAAQLDGFGLEEPADGESIGRNVYVPAGD